MVNVKPVSLQAGGSENLSEICVVLVCGKPCEWVWCCETGMSDVFVSAGINLRGHIEPEDWKTLEWHGQGERSGHLCLVGLQRDLESFYGGGVEAKQKWVEYVFFLDYCHGSVWGIERSDVWPKGRVILYASPLAREMPCAWPLAKEMPCAWPLARETLCVWT